MHLTLLHTPVLQMLQSIHTQGYMCAATLRSALHCWELHALYVCSRLLATYGPHMVQSYPPRSTGWMPSLGIHLLTIDLTLYVTC